MSTRNGGALIKESTKWVTAACAPLGLILPVYLTMLENSSDLERRVLLIEERAIQLNRHIDQFELLYSNERSFGPDGFDNPKFRSLLNNTIRSETKDLINKDMLDRIINLNQLKE
jgi:hypothetical protein